MKELDLYTLNDPASGLNQYLAVPHGFPIPPIDGLIGTVGDLVETIQLTIDRHIPGIRTAAVLAGIQDNGWSVIGTGYSPSPVDTPTQ